MRECFITWSLCVVMTFAAGCNGTRQLDTTESLRLIDAATGNPIAECAGVSLVAKTPWHRWSDPCETPFGDWRVVWIQVLDGHDAQLRLPEYSAGRGSIFFLVQHERRGAVLFAPGYVPGLHGYISLQFHVKDSAAALSLASRPAWATADTVPTFRMIPLGTGQARTLKEEAHALKIGKEKLSFLFNQEAMWSDLIDRYRAGKDAEAIKLICDWVVLTLDSLPDEDKTAVTKDHLKTVEWCLKVSRAHPQ